MLYDRRVGFYEYLLDLLGAGSGEQRLLDIGCGFGHFLQVARQRGYQPTGSEVDRDFAIRAEKRCGCPVVCKGLSALRSTAAPFDVITLIDSFYYFSDPVGVLRNCAQLLSRGGRILIRVTNRNHLARLHRWKSLLLGGHDRELPFWTTDDAICCHSRRSLTAALAAAGFEIERISGKESGKRPKPGLRSLAVAAAQWIERITAGHVSASSGVIVIARRREIFRAAERAGRTDVRSSSSVETLVARGAST
jgi:SAM-dependent methyltransferase